MQDSSVTSITRVLQQEVFADDCTKGNFPFHLITKDAKPIFFINIADIKVAVYRMIFPDSYSTFTSNKLHDYSFITFSEMFSKPLRPGVGEIVEKFEELRFMPASAETIVINSKLNLALSELPSHHR